MTERDPYADAVASSLSTAGLGGAPVEKDPYLEAVESTIGGTGTRLKAAAIAAPAVGPDRYAQARELGARRGTTAEAVLPDLDALALQDRQERLVREAPRVAEFLSTPERQALAADDYDGLSYFDKVLHEIVATREALVQAPLAGAIQYAGMAVGGVGELYALGERTLDRGLRALSPTGALWGDGVDVPDWLEPEQALIGTGALVQSAAAAVGVPEDRRTAATEVFGGVGQLGGMVLQSVFAAPTLVPSLFAVGAEQQAAKAREAGTYGSGGSDVAIASGAGITAITERWGIDQLLDRLPPQVKNRTLQWLADKFIAGVQEGGQEAVEAVAQNLVTRTYTDPDQSLTEGVANEAGTAFGAAAIVRTLLGARGHPSVREPAPEGEAESGALDPAQLAEGARLLAGALPSAADATRLVELQAAARAVKTADRDPAAVADFVREQADRTPGLPAHVYLDAQAVATYFQDRGEDPAARIGELMGSPTALQEALVGTGDLVIPLGDFVAGPLRDATHGDALRDLARLAPDRLSNAELTALEPEALLARFRSDLEGEADVPRGTDTEVDALTDEIRVGLEATGRYDAGATEKMARSLAHNLVTRAQRRGRGESGRDLLDRIGLRFLGDTASDRAARVAPVDVVLDPLIDDVLAHGTEPRSRTTGKTLVQAIIDAGGIDPDSVGAGDLKAQGALQRPGLLRRGGLTAEAMGELLAEQDSGWTDLFTTKDEFGRPEVNEFVALVVDALQDNGPQLADPEAARFDSERDAVAAVMRRLAARGTDLQAIGRPALRQLVEEGLGAEFQQPAYHGTHARGIEAEGFKLQKIGTGEGAQVYGWGLYFASQRKIAEWYRETVSQKHAAVKVSLRDPGTGEAMNFFLGDGELGGWMTNHAPNMPLELEDDVDAQEQWRQDVTDAAFDLEAYIDETGQVPVPAWVDSAVHQGRFTPDRAPYYRHLIDVLRRANARADESALHPFTYDSSDGRVAASRADVVDLLSDQFADGLDDDGTVAGVAQAVASAMLEDTPDAYLDSVMGLNKPHRELASAMREYLDEIGLKREKRGQVYEVDVPDSGDLLDWDKPMSEQPQAVKDKLAEGGFVILDEEAIEAHAREILDRDLEAWLEEGAERGEDRDPVDFTNNVDSDEYYETARQELTGGADALDPKLTGKGLYKQLMDEAGYRPSLLEGRGEYQQAASHRLFELGIPGLKYADATSRGRDADSHNFVIWDESRIAVTQTFYQQALPDDATAEQLRARIAELEKELRTDPLTGLRNRRAFDEDAALGWPAVAVLDLDGLKKLNDRMGHQAGDTMLEGAAGVMLAAESDTVRFYRQGGDEFTARFADPAQAAAVMREVVDRLASVDLVLDTTDGTFVYAGIGAGYGIGQDFQEADARQNDDKRARAAAGLRQARDSDGPPRQLRRAADRPAAEGDGQEPGGVAEDVAPWYTVAAPRRATDPAQAALEFPDPYETLPTRPDTSPALEARGRAALHAVVRRYGGTVLGDAIGAELARTGQAQLAGQTVTTSADLAALASVYRDPTFETIRWVFVDAAGAVVGESAYTSRLPSAATLWDGDGQEAWRPDDLGKWLQATARGFGAAQVWMLHNHPSGDPSPSPADVRATVAVDSALRTLAAGAGPKPRGKKALADWQPPLALAGHVVINHSKFTYISAQGDVRTQPLDAPLPDFRATPSLPHPALGQGIGSPQDVAAIGAGLAAEGQAALVFTSSRGVVTLLATVPQSAFADPANAKRLHRLIVRAGAGQGAFLVADPAFIQQHKGQLRAMVQTRLLVDAIPTDVPGNSLRMTTTPVAGFDSGIPDTRTLKVAEDTFQQAGPVFQSALLAAVEAAEGAPKQGTAAQWRGWLDGAQRRGAFKAAEREWMGVDAWLTQAGTVTRAQLQDFVRASQLVVEEDVKGKEPSDFTPEALDDLPFKVGRRGHGRHEVVGPHGSMGLYDSADEADVAAYQYSVGYVRAQGGQMPEVPRGFMVARVDERDLEDFGLPAADLGLWALFEDKGVDQNPRDKGEIVGDPDRVNTSYPRAVLAAIQDAAEMAGGDDAGGVLAGFRVPGQEAPFRSMTLPGGSAYKVMLLKLPRGGQEDFTEGHWTEPNVVAHIRFDERTDSDGKRVLFVQEIQSDWHQKGRKQGYADGVPDAPFKTTWPELAMKRMVRWSAENGFDRVAWPTAEQVPQIEGWGMTLAQIEADEGARKRFGAILDRYRTQVPRLMKALGKPYGAQVVESTLTLGDSAESIEPLPRLDPMDDADRMAFAGAEDFDNGDPPLMGVISLRFNGVERHDVMAVVDGNGVSFHSDGGDINEIIEWDDFEAGDTPASAEDASMLLLGSWNTPPGGSDLDPDGPASLWDLLPTAIRAPQRQEATVPALEITPALREAALAGLALFQEGEAPRGSIQFTAAETLIRLTERADLSTVHHEFGHLFLEGLVEDAFLEGADPQLAADLDAALAWMAQTTGVALDARVADGPSAVRAALRREHHEAFAEGYETYLAEGRAPSPALADLFARFRAWMLAVYGALKAKRVPLSDAMRGLYDRLLASDAEIAAAEGRAGMEGLPAGLAVLVSPARWAAYTAALQAGRDDARAQADALVLRAHRQEAEAWWREEWERTEAQVTREALADRTQRALSLLSRGVLPDGSEPPLAIQPLDAAALKREFGEAFVRDRLQRKRVYRREGGMPPAVAADLLGFRNAAELVAALADARPFREHVKAETDARMRARYTDPRTDGRLADTALQAVHGGKRLAALEAELALVAELAGQPAPTARVLGAMARRLVNAKPLREVRPNDYLVAERKAAREAQQALAAARPRFAEALMAKRRQVMNAHLYRAALEAKQVEEKEAAYLKRFLKPKTRARLGKVGRGYLEQIDALLAQISLAPASAPEIGRRAALLAFVAQAEARGETIAIPPALLALAETTNIRDLSVDALRGVADTVRQIDHKARRWQTLFDGQQAREAEAVDDAMADSVRASFAAAPDRTGDPTRGERVAATVASIDVLRLLPSNVARELDGYAEGGAVWAHTIRVIRDAVYGRVNPALQAMREQFADTLRRHYSKAELRELDTARYVEAVGDSWSHNRKLALALNWGNVDNRDRILNAARGRLTAEQVGAILGTLDARDWAFVQDVAAQINAFWPEIRDTWRRRSGLAPEKVEPSPFTVRTADGQVLELPGWYYPIRYDADRSGIQVAQDEADDYFQSMTTSRLIRAQTRHGHTEARVGGGGRTVRLDLSVAETHMRDVIRDLYLGDAVNYVHRALQGGRFKAALNAAGKLEHFRALELWLRDVATGELVASRGWEAVLGAIRRNLSAAVLTFKVSTGLLQLTGLVQAASEIGNRNVLAGAWRFKSMPMTGPNSVWAYVDAASPFMRDRNGQVTDGVQQVASARAGRFGAGRAAAERLGWAMIARLQRVADVITWLAAERKGLRDFDGDVARARAYADDVVIRAQSANDFIDKPAVIRGNLGQNVRQSELVRSLVPFMSYMLAKGNIARERYQGTRFRDPVQVLRFGAQMVQLFAVEAMLMALIKGGLPDDEDEDPAAWGYGTAADEWVAFIGRETVLGFVGTIPVLSQLATEGRGYTAQSPAERAADIVGRFGKEGAEVFVDEDGDGYVDGVDRAAAKVAVDLLGVTLGAPSSQINVTLDAVWDAAEGEDVAPLDYVIKPEKKDRQP